ncbi:MAG: polymorphic toxin type 44 domain-containing protein [Candidatus Gracilibacteria bacterium]|nr:polymorphic toxin type 44 domain-containing protein [Candidatus Gracilibacteria bacterium]
MNPKFCKHGINKPADINNNSKKYNFKGDYPGGEIHYKGNIIYLSDIGNVLYGYLGACIGFSYKHIENCALKVTQAAEDDGAKKEGALQNELRDRPYYRIGYSLGRSYPPNKLRKDLIISSILSVNPYKYEEKTEK